jgi:hypothetical protein
MIDKHVEKHELYGPFWSQCMLESAKYVNFPAIHVSRFLCGEICQIYGVHMFLFLQSPGWFDVFLGVMLDSWELYQYHSQPGALMKQKLIVGRHRTSM